MYMSCHDRESSKVIFLELYTLSEDYMRVCLLLLFGIKLPVENFLHNNNFKGNADNTKFFFAE